MPTATSEHDSPVVPPRFVGYIAVTQSGPARRVLLILLISMLCTVPFFAVPMSLIDHEATGWMGLIAAFGVMSSAVLGLAAMCGGFILGALIENWWDRRRKVTRFDATTQVQVDAEGFAVEGLGTMTWAEVLAVEGIPDSESAFVVHTALFGRLLLQASVSSVAPVFRHYLVQHAEAQRVAAWQSRGGQHNFKALVFNWPRFVAWILAGYLVGAAIAVALIFAGDRPLVGLLVAMLLAPASAWLVWSIPFWQLTTFSASRMRAFQLQGYVLSSADGRWRIDLRAARVRYRNSRGVGYELNFISIRPEQGRRLDLVPDDQDLDSLVFRLKELGVISESK